MIKEIYRENVLDLLEVKLNARAFQGVSLILDVNGRAEAKIPWAEVKEKQVDVTKVMEWYREILGSMPDNVSIPIMRTCGSSMSFTYKKSDGSTRTVSTCQSTRPKTSDDNEDHINLANEVRASASLANNPWA